MNIILFDEPASRLHLLPFTFTRPVSKIRVGILTIAEKWEKWLGGTSSYITEEYLASKFPLKKTSDNVLINGILCPDEDLVNEIKNLPVNTCLMKEGLRLALRTNHNKISAFDTAEQKEYTKDIVMIDEVWKIFQLNGSQIRKDFALLTHGRKSENISDRHTSAYEKENIFLEEGVKIHAAILNAENGPIYLGKNSIVQEGAMIRGPFALCEGGHINMGGKMRGDTTIGPYSKAGGEVSNSVLFANSNKAHDGFLGNSVIGEWCNLGADTNTSNLKNNYENIKVWSYTKGGFKDTGLQFCGLLMGDHSKSGINTMFNTGTMVGVSANIFGDGFPRQFIPSFSWGGASGFSTFQLSKAIATAEKVVARRNQTLDDHDRQILKTVFELSANNRIWEKK